ncbi:hypothetical protein NDU88_000869 [Pleurodeles waltl]|uniref:Uncharacterized protein n=1 Tax=Pleurodeles waltl TaxID=8319 RepID=A0AAV7KZ06_PLEWA|nr:hypothetical protein NDU88_000869 [Pleurodeles waltl]
MGLERHEDDKGFDALVPTTLSLSALELVAPAVLGACFEAVHASLGSSLFYAEAFGKLRLGPLLLAFMSRMLHRASHLFYAEAFWEPRLGPLLLAFVSRTPHQASPLSHTGIWKPLLPMLCLSTAHLGPSYSGHFRRPRLVLFSYSPSL